MMKKKGRLLAAIGFSIEILLHTFSICFGVSKLKHTSTDRIFSFTRAVQYIFQKAIVKWPFFTHTHVNNKQIHSHGRYIAQKNTKPIPKYVSK